MLRYSATASSFNHVLRDCFKSNHIALLWTGKLCFVTSFVFFSLYIYYVHCVMFMLQLYYLFCFWLSVINLILTFHITCV